MNTRASIWPRTILGGWSVGLAIAAVMLMVMVPIFEYGLDIGPGSVGLRALGGALGISGLAAFVTGITSITKSRERSVLVFLALLVGPFALIAAADLVFVTNSAGYSRRAQDARVPAILR